MAAGTILTAPDSDAVYKAGESHRQLMKGVFLVESSPWLHRKEICAPVMTACYNDGRT
jgi:hypothetical protein